MRRINLSAFPASKNYSLINVNPVKSLTYNGQKCDARLEEKTRADAQIQA